MLKSYWRRALSPEILLPLTVAVLIVITGIIFKQSFWRMLPLFVSLIISYLQSHLNRYAPLLGGCNSVVYAAVSLSYGMYASMAQSLLFSCPIQLVTFFRWKKKAWKRTTVFRKMSWLGRLLATLGFAALWALLYVILSALGSSYILLDNSITLLGILTSVLTMLSFIEYTVLMPIGCVFSLLLYIRMIPEHPEQVTYLVFTLYSFYCQIVALRRIGPIYRAQQNGIAEEA